MRIISILIILYNLLLPVCLFAFSVEETLPNSEQEKRARALFAEVRCLVCAGQSVADSDVLLAQDLRRLIRKMIHEGNTDEDIRAYLVSRYGEQALLRPPLAAYTYFLWFGPMLILVVGLVGMIFALRKCKAT